jgi:hypothetical protein
LTVEVGGVATSFFAYRPGLLRPLVPSPWGIAVASIPDIVAMKVAAIAGRGSRKDFVDLYVVSREVAPLAEILEWFDEKYRGVPYERYHVLKSLIYFDDADAEPDLDLLRPLEWDDVKRHFARNVPPLFDG